MTEEYLELLLGPADDRTQDRDAFKDDSRVPVIGVEDDFAVGSETNVGQADLLDGVVPVAPDDVLGKAGAAGLEVIDARLLTAILSWMDLPRFIGETLSLHPNPKELF